MKVHVRFGRAGPVGGLSEHAAARLFGIDHKTVSRILKHPVPAGYRRSKLLVRPKLDRFLPVIDRIFEACRALPKKRRRTARRMFERLRDEHGLTGGFTDVSDCMREKRRRTQNVIIPLAHPPGHAQIDLGEALGEIRGVRCNLHCIAMVDVESAIGSSGKVRGGSVCLNRFRAAVKWISALVTPPPGLASAG